MESPRERWRKGISHNPKSIKLAKAIFEIDLKYNNDYFCWKLGGDGDNGEQLMYLLDIYFEEENKKIIENSFPYEDLDEYAIR